MSVHFSGWEVLDDGAAFPGGELQQSQRPKNKGVYTMYHGTSVQSARLIIANGFKQSSRGMLGKGVYVSRDRRKASHYPKNIRPKDRVVLQLLVRVGRVKRIDQQGHPMQLTWHDNGYDTAWVPPNCGHTGVPSGMEEDCVFDPKRVKVVNIAMAQDSTKSELQQLIARSASGDGGEGGDGGRAQDQCSLCRRKTQEGSVHIKQKCWSCGENICILMSKHNCRMRRNDSFNVEPMHS